LTFDIRTLTFDLVRSLTWPGWRHTWWRHDVSKTCLYWFGHELVWNRI